LKRLQEPAPQINPHLERPPTVDAVECFLSSLFLRRYITYCARKRRYAQMRGAARLYRGIAAALENFLVPVCADARQQSFRVEPINLASAYSPQRFPSFI